VSRERFPISMIPLYPTAASAPSITVTIKAATASFIPVIVGLGVCTRHRAMATARPKIINPRTSKVSASSIHNGCPEIKAAARSEVPTISRAWLTPPARATRGTGDPTITGSI